MCGLGMTATNYWPEMGDAKAKPFTFIFYVRGKCGPDRYLMASMASSKSDAQKRGKAFAKANHIRFIEASEGPVSPSLYDALEIEPFPNL